MNKHPKRASGKTGFFSRALALALCLTLLLTLAACGGGGIVRPEAPVTKENPFADTYAWAEEQERSYILMFYDDLTWDYSDADGEIYEEGDYSIDEDGWVTLTNEDSEETIWGYIDDDGQLMLTDGETELYYFAVDSTYFDTDEPEAAYNVFAEIDRWTCNDDSSQVLVFYFDMSWEVYDDDGTLSHVTYALDGNGKAYLYEDDGNYLGWASVTEGGVLVLDNGDFTESFLPPQS